MAEEEDQYSPEDRQEIQDDLMMLDRAEKSPSPYADDEFSLVNDAHSQQDHQD